MRVLVCSDNCQVDSASLTGESEPIKRTDRLTNENPLETKNLAFFGTSVPQGSRIGIIVNTGDQTAMGRIASLTASPSPSSALTGSPTRALSRPLPSHRHHCRATATTAEQTPIAKEIEHFVHIVFFIAIFLGFLFFVIGVVIGTPVIVNAAADLQLLARD